LRIDFCSMWKSPLTLLREDLLLNFKRIIPFSMLYILNCANLSDDERFRHISLGAESHQYWQEGGPSSCSTQMHSNTLAADSHQYWQEGPRSSCSTQMHSTPFFNSAGFALRSGIYLSKKVLTNDRRNPLEPMIPSWIHYYYLTSVNTIFTHFPLSTSFLSFNIKCGALFFSLLILAVTFSVIKKSSLRSAVYIYEVSVIKR